MRNVNKKLAIRRIRRYFRQRAFAVPELQREFVWDGRKAAALLDSIDRGYPIGSVMVWRTRRWNQNLLRHQLTILPPFDPSNREILFIIDGQQRLSVLWQLLRDEPGIVTNSIGRDVNFTNVLMDLDPRAEDRFLYRRRPTTESMVRVVEVLARDWRTKIAPWGRRNLKRAEEFRHRFFSYEVAATFIEARELEDIREVFIRINSQGMKIGAADRAFARATKIKLRHLVNHVRDQMPRGFDRISSEVILTSAALAFDATDIGERALQTLVDQIESNDRDAARFGRRVWPRLQQGLLRAVDYLAQEFDVTSYSALPSDYLVAVLALFFMERRGARPSRRGRAKLRRWFWATVVGARYAGRGFRPNIMNDARFMRRLANDDGAHMPGVEPTPLDVLKRTEYLRGGMLVAGYFCLLRRMEPAYLEDGEPVVLDDPASAGNRHQMHHIFPRALLDRNHVPRRLANAIANVCLVVARENQSIGSKHPRTYLKELPASGYQRRRALRTHLIPAGPRGAIWNRGVRTTFKRFLDERSRLVARAFEREAGCRLFSRSE